MVTVVPNSNRDILSEVNIWVPGSLEVNVRSYHQYVITIILGWIILRINCKGIL